MAKAYCLIRREPHYRREAFMQGLAAAGYDVRTGDPHGIEPGDVVVMWNRYGDKHELATRVERQGGIVLVAENGYVRGRHQGGDYYALAIGGHNGSGVAPIGGPERWAALGVELKPWRENGEHILVCPNRSFGRPDMIMPTRWAADVSKRLAAVTKRPIKVRPHPGNDRPTIALEHDLKDAWACVVWSSSAGVHALIAGIPVIAECPYWICKGAAFDVGAIESLNDTHPGIFAGFRQTALERLAWAQWNIEELAGGEPFRLLLSDARQAAGAAAA